MSGHLSGVQTIMREKYMSRALYVHCHAHRLHLAIADVAKVVPCVADFFGIISKLFCYFTRSGVTNRLFREAQEELGLGMLLI